MNLLNGCCAIFVIDRWILRFSVQKTLPVRSAWLFIPSNPAPHGVEGQPFQLLDDYRLFLPEAKESAISSTTFLYIVGIAAVVGGSSRAGLPLPRTIAILLATSLAGEQISPGYDVGAILVLLGVWFGALRPNMQRSSN